MTKMMKEISCKNAYYIKLGESGKWEESSIKENIMRIGWKHQSLSDINSGNWKVIRDQLSTSMNNQGALTRDCKALQTICESTYDDIWISFHKSSLWWCKVLDKEIYQDDISKFRKVEKWHCQDINGNQLLSVQIPGKIARLQAFRGTSCKVRDVEGLMRLINCQPSEEYQTIFENKEKLYTSVEFGLRKLHWKDFETLVDLVFRASGWNRISLLGETMKFSDLELEDPINGEFYQVQIKSRATMHDFEYYSNNFDPNKYRRLFFVVHTPDLKLSQHHTPNENPVQLILPVRFAEMVVDLGILNWLLQKIK